MRLFSYKMTHDTGFAPNPFGRTLTLANCRPRMREKKRVGDWVAGLTTKTLHNDPVGEERLVYLMKVGEKLLFRDYFEDKRFQDKKPDMNPKNPTAMVGDNIYRPLHSDALEAIEFERLNNCSHADRDKKGDIGGMYVLIAQEFYYFGRSPIGFPVNLRPKISSRRPPPHGVLTPPELAGKLIDYIRENYKLGMNDLPYTWPCCQI